MDRLFKAFLPQAKALHAGKGSTPEDAKTIAGSEHILRQIETADDEFGIALFGSAPEIVGRKRSSLSERMLALRDWAKNRRR
jgi:hypothetical protein